MESSEQSQVNKPHGTLLYASHKITGTFAAEPFLFLPLLCQILSSEISPTRLRRYGLHTRTRIFSQKLATQLPPFREGIAEYVVTKLDPLYLRRKRARPMQWVQVDPRLKKSCICLPTPALIKGTYQDDSHVFANSRHILLDVENQWEVSSACKNWLPPSSTIPQFLNRTRLFRNIEMYRPQLHNLLPIW